VVQRAADMGYTANFAGEFEFFLFREDSDSIREKGYRDLKHLSPGMFGYSGLRAGTYSEELEFLFEQLARFDVHLEGLHTETGPGVYEVAVAHDEAVKAADQAFLFKTASKEILSRCGIMPTFMAKVSADLPGCSGHTHQSLWSNGASAFHDPDDAHGMSALFKSYVAGLLKLMPEFMLLYCPTVNSYKRTVPGLWAPTSATWSADNRTSSLRVIRSESGGGTRVENRLVGSDMNPYLAFAGSLAAGLWGIEQGLELGPPVVGNAYELQDDKAEPLPRTLWDAAQRFKQSAAARACFGDAFVEHYAATREWEAKQYRKAVTNWELERYFEII
jgi:glutamine synthetase